MFDEIIMMLEEAGIDFEEDYDAGTLVINVEAIDKVQLIEIIGFINDTGLEFTIDEMSLVVMGAEEPMEVEVEEPMDDAALNEMLGM